MYSKEAESNLFLASCGQRYSTLLSKTTKETPKEAEAVSHSLLRRGGFIDRALVAGIYTFLPLGWRVHQKIAQIIREEINKIGGQEIAVPIAQPQQIWEETNRWETFIPPLFKFKDRFGRNFCLAPTHEEVITDIVRRYIHSYRDLPFAIYQIQDKFRNEARAAGGLLRTREFWMKDLYSFHADQEDLDQYYLLVRQAYFKIFNRCGLEPKVVSASSGSIGGAVSHEFMVVTDVGEDRIAYCSLCNWAANFETLTHSAKDKVVCPQCGSRDIKTARAIEVSHIFQLGTTYSEPMKAYFTDKNGVKKPILMGCYGIGLGRLLATVAEINHDKRGIIWPWEISPFKVHLVEIDLKEDQKVRQGAELIYSLLTGSGIEVLFDDREKVSVGEKLADADLIGCPIRAVVSRKTLKQNKIEIKERKGEKVSLVEPQELINLLRTNF